MQASEDASALLDSHGRKYQRASTLAGGNAKLDSVVFLEAATPQSNMSSTHHDVLLGRTIRGERDQDRGLVSSFGTCWDVEREVFHSEDNSPALW